MGNITKKTKDQDEEKLFEPEKKTGSDGTNDKVKVKKIESVSDYKNENAGETNSSQRKSDEVNEESKEEVINEPIGKEYSEKDEEKVIPEKEEVEQKKEEEPEEIVVEKLKAEEKERKEDQDKMIQKSEEEKLPKDLNEVLFQFDEVPLSEKTHNSTYEILDTKTNNLHPNERIHATTVTNPCSKNEIFFFGGNKVNNFHNISQRKSVGFSSSFNDFWKFDTKTEAWMEMEHLPFNTESSFKSIESFVFDKKLYLFPLGSSQIDEDAQVCFYNFENGRWEEESRMKYKDFPSLFKSVEVNGLLFIISIDSKNSDNIDSKKFVVRALDLETFKLSGEWKQTGDIPNISIRESSVEKEYSSSPFCLFPLRKEFFMFGNAIDSNSSTTSNDQQQLHCAHPILEEERLGWSIITLPKCCKSTSSSSPKVYLDRYVIRYTYNHPNVILRILDMKDEPSVGSFRLTFESCSSCCDHELAKKKYCPSLVPSLHIHDASIFLFSGGIINLETKKAVHSRKNKEEEEEEEEEIEGETTSPSSHLLHRVLKIPCFEEDMIFEYSEKLRFLKIRDIDISRDYYDKIPNLQNPTLLVHPFHPEKILVIGGIPKESKEASFGSKKIYVYNYHFKSWGKRDVIDVPIEFYDHKAFIYRQSLIFITVPFSAPEESSSKMMKKVNFRVYEYNFRKKKWRVVVLKFDNNNKELEETPKNSFSAALVGDEIYIFEGVSNYDEDKEDESHVEDVYRLNLRNGLLEKLEFDDDDSVDNNNVPPKRNFSQTCVVGDDIYFLEGIISSSERKNRNLYLFHTNPPGWSNGLKIKKIISSLKYPHLNHNKNIFLSFANQGLLIFGCSRNCSGCADGNSKRDRFVYLLYIIDDPSSSQKEIEWKKYEVSNLPKNEFFEDTSGIVCNVFDTETDSFQPVLHLFHSTKITTSTASVSPKGSEKKKKKCCRDCSNNIEEKKEILESTSVQTITLPKFPSSSFLKIPNSTNQNEKKMFSLDSQGIMDLDEVAGFANENIRILKNRSNYFHRPKSIEFLMLRNEFLEYNDELIVFVCYMDKNSIRDPYRHSLEMKVYVDIWKVVKKREHAKESNSNNNSPKVIIEGMERYFTKYSVDNNLEDTEVDLRKDSRTRSYSAFIHQDSLIVIPECRLHRTRLEHFFKIDLSQRHEPKKWEKIPIIFKNDREEEKHPSLERYEICTTNDPNRVLLVSGVVSNFHEIVREGKNLLFEFNPSTGELKNLTMKQSGDIPFPRCNPKVLFFEDRSRSTTSVHERGVMYLFGGGLLHPYGELMSLYVLDLESLVWKEINGGNSFNYFSVFSKYRCDVRDNYKIGTFGHEMCVYKQRYLMFFGG